MHKNHIHSNNIIFINIFSDRHTTWFDIFNIYLFIYFAEDEQALSIYYKKKTHKKIVLC